MLKIKEWLDIRKDKQFKIMIENKGSFFATIIIPAHIVAVKRLSDGLKFTNSSMVCVRGKKFRIREFYYDFKTVRLQYEHEELICDIEELYYESYSK